MRAIHHRCVGVAAALLVLLTINAPVHAAVVTVVPTGTKMNTFRLITTGIYTYSGFRTCYKETYDLNTGPSSYSYTCSDASGSSATGDIIASDIPASGSYSEYTAGMGYALSTVTSDTYPGVSVTLGLGVIIDVEMTYDWVLSGGFNQNLSLDSVPVILSGNSGSGVLSAGFHLFRFSDGIGSSSSGWTGTVQITLRDTTALMPAAIDDGPVAVTEGVAQIIPVGTNDTGFIDPVTVTLTTPPTKGTIGAISPPGPAAGMTITYTANIGTVGADSFDYQMTDSTPASDTATVTVNISPDTDGDGVSDGSDNCTLVANASQCDSDADGYGNHCDGDMNNNTATNSQDYVLFRQQLGQPSVGPTYNKGDINCNGVVNTQDYVLFRQLLGSPPGPSGFVP